jgi:hypothetical protein
MFWYCVVNVLTFGLPFAIKVAVRKAIIEAAHINAVAKLAA